MNAKTCKVKKEKKSHFNGELRTCFINGKTFRSNEITGKGINEKTETNF